MKTAADNLFAARVMERLKEGHLSNTSMISDPAHRIFYDPPELIQQAFGGRAWFFETGCSRVHRVGVFKGLGWELDPVFARQDERGITGVRITARPHHRDKVQKYDMEFLSRTLPEDTMDPVAVRVIDHRPGLTADQLKPAYAEVLGEHVV